MRDLVMSSQLCKDDLLPACHEYADADGIPYFSTKVTERLTAMSALADCYLVSSDGARHHVHKAKLTEQSKVFRQAC